MSFSIPLLLALTRATLPLSPDPTPYSPPLLRSRASPRYYLDALLKHARLESNAPGMCVFSFQ
jgi:hypothetical protein